MEPSYSESTDRLTMTPDEIVAVTGLSLSSVHRAIRSGQLRSVRIGGRRLITRQAVCDMLDGR